jgi:tetratricopeptide (TPR) repeat protein
MTRGTVWLAIAAALAACATGPRRVEDAVDPAVYATCQDPAAAAAWQRAQAAQRRGDDAAALPDLVLVVAACPDLVRAHIAWQDVAMRLGGAAHQAMVDYYRTMPDGGTPVAAYCRARLLDTDYAKDNALAAILARDPSFAWAHLSRARVSRQRGRLLSSLDMYAAALVHDGQLHEARWERAQVLVELGREMEAAREFRAYLAARPEDVAAIREFVTLLLYRLGRIDEATPWLLQLEARLPGDATVRMDRAAVSWREGRHREAAETYLDILRQQPALALAALNLGLLYYEVVPGDDEHERRRFWPRARAAFRWFLARGGPAEGHEQFERTLGVPFRLQRIGELLGPEPETPPSLDEMRWPGAG